MVHQRALLLWTVVLLARSNGAQYVDFLDPTPHAVYSYRNVQLNFAVHLEDETIAQGSNSLGFVAKVSGFQLGRVERQEFATAKYSYLARNMPDGRHDFVILFDDGLEQAIRFDVRADGVVQQHLERLRSACGHLCNTSMSGQPAEHFELVRKQVDCPALWTSKDMDALRSALEPASPIIPKEMEGAFLYQGRVPVSYDKLWAWPKRDSTSWTQQWTREDITKQARLCGADRLTGAYSLRETQEVFAGLGRMPTLPGGHVLVIGSESPWLEACVLAAGASRVTTIEYGEVQSLHPRVSVMTPAQARELLFQGRMPAFDAVVTYSSVEHTGLGRYGDAMNPWGDIMTIGRAWCVAKDGAYMLLGVPFGREDLVKWNEARFYGPVMMPHLTANWEVVWKGGDPQDPQPVFVLRRLSADSEEERRGERHSDRDGSFGFREGGESCLEGGTSGSDRTAAAKGKAGGGTQCSWQLQCFDQAEGRAAGGPHGGGDSRFTELEEFEPDGDEELAERGGPDGKQRKGSVDAEAADEGIGDEEIEPRWSGGCEAAPSGQPPWPLECHLAPVRGFPAPESFQARPDLVIATLIPWLNYQGFDPVSIATCPTKCTMLFAESKKAMPLSCIEQADVYMAGPLDNAPNYYVKPSWQWFLHFSLESATYYPTMDDAAYMRPFELSFNFRLSSHLPLSLAPRDPEVIRRALTEPNEGVVLYLANHCVEWREAIARQLMEHLPGQVASLGKCLNTGPRPKLGSVQLISRYWFFLALENANETDWVTERIFNAWIAGSIPIYVGAPNIAEFAPHPHSYILVSDFPSIPALAQYIAYLAHNETARQEYLAFKDPAVPLSPGFLHASRRSHYAKGEDLGASVPFVPADVGGAANPVHASPRQWSDPACFRYSPELGHVDAEGLSVFDNRSRCFDALLDRSRSQHRGGMLDGCRICTAISRAREAARARCAAPGQARRLDEWRRRRTGAGSGGSPHGSPESGYESQGSAPSITVHGIRDGERLASGPVRVTVEVEDFAIPAQGSLVVTAGRLGSERPLTRVVHNSKDEGAHGAVRRFPTEFAFGAGQYWSTVRLPSIVLGLVRVFVSASF